MTSQGFTLFDTPIGRCGIAWDADRIVGVQLPEASAAATRGRLRRHLPKARETAPPPEVRHAIDAIVADLSSFAGP